MIISVRKIFLLTLTCFVSAISFAQSNADKELNTLIEKICLRYKPENPGCQLAISRNDSLIYSKAWGKSDLENDTPLTTKSLIEAGSVSKQFTAAAILLLAQQGKLSIDDDIRKYVPETRDYGTAIKIKHLIHHTSGLKDWGSIAALTGWGRGTKTYNNEDALEIIVRQETLNNTPGAEFIYSNSNYNLLAIIIKRVSGLSLAEFTKQYIFIPAGMTQTQWRDNYKRIVPGRSIAYQKTTTAYETDMPNENVYGNGGLLTTTEDLLKWNSFYLSGKLGNPSLLQKQIATDKFNNNVTNYYGAGLFIQTQNGYKVIRHSGATASYRCYLAYYPEKKLSIAWLSNTSQYDTARYNVTAAIENFLVPRIPTKRINSDNEIAVHLTPAQLEPFQGWYRNNKSGDAIYVQAKGEELLVNTLKTVPLGQNRFRTNGQVLIFEKGKGLISTNEDRDTTAYTLVAPFDFSQATLPQYTGSYYSNETLSSMTVTQKENVLTIAINSNYAYTLRPMYKDAFATSNFGGILYFERDTQGNITDMKISISRARNVGFKRTK